MANNTSPLTGLAKSAVQQGLLDNSEAVEAQKSALIASKAFIVYASEEKLVDESELASLAAYEFGAPLFDLETIDRELIPSESLESSIFEKHTVLPIFKRGNKLFVAVSDPTNMAGVDAIKFASGMSVDAILVEHSKLTSLIQVFKEKSEQADLDSDFEDSDLDNIDVATVEDKNEDDGTSGADEAPIVRFCNKLLLDAIKKGASDLHFEPYEKSYRVRYRIDGILSEVASPPTNLATRIAARLKVMSRLDIAERRVPQDGRIKLKLSKTKAIDFRVSTLPTLYGEKIVMRILDPSSAMLGIDVLGYEQVQKEAYLNALSKPQGMILVTGPTGSGKTVSLYTGVNILNIPEVNISTAEDPVEINLEGVNQVNVDVKQGMTFSKALKAFLRQDPDTILVGEIRDLETAEIAIKAAQTGHLVLSTLHTNSAPETLTRLINMGVPAFNIATSVSLIIAQRLARRLCKSCKRVVDVPDKELLAAGFKQDELAEIQIYEPVGCNACTKGYKGRVGIYQVMPISDAIGRIVMEGGNAIQIADQAKAEGIHDLRISAMEKAKQGVTSLEEAYRVTTD
jgi:type IV pilus assembly protein PilB